MSQQPTFWKDIPLGPVTLRANGVVDFPKGKLRLTHGEMALGWLRELEELNPFYQGAIWDRLKHDHPETHTQALSDLGPSRGSTLDEYARVHRKVPPSERRASLEWSKHQVVAALTPKERKRILDKAEKEHLSVSDVRQEARLVRRRTVAEGQAPLEGQHRVVLVDPEYRDVSVEDLATWPVPSHLTPASAVFVRHYEAQRFSIAAVLEAWGLTHHRTLFWDRVQAQGPDGWGINQRMDYVVLATRGKLTPDRTAPLVQAVQQCRSDGPVPVERIQETVAQLYTEGPYLLVSAKAEMVEWTPGRQLRAV